MTNIAKARDALEALKKSAAPENEEHYETLSAALEALGQRVIELEQRARQTDGMAAAAAGFAASLPGADAINVADATAMASQLAAEGGQAEFDVKRIADLAKTNKRP
jgi:hypothetical protein